MFQISEIVFIFQLFQISNDKFLNWKSIHFVTDLSKFSSRKNRLIYIHTFYTWIDFELYIKWMKKKKKWKCETKWKKEIENSNNSNKNAMNETQMQGRVKVLRQKNCCQCQSIVVYIISIGHLFFLKESEIKI